MPEVAERLNSNSKIDIDSNTRFRYQYKHGLSLIDASILGSDSNTEAYDLIQLEKEFAEFQPDEQFLSPVFFSLDSLMDVKKLQRNDKNVMRLS